MSRPWLAPSLFPFSSGAGSGGGGGLDRFDILRFFFPRVSRISTLSLSLFLLLLFDGHVGGHVGRSWMSTRVRRREEWDGRHTPSTNEGWTTRGEEENTPEVLNGTTPKKGPPLPPL